MGCICINTFGPHCLELHLIPNTILILGGKRKKKINPCNFSFSLATDIIPYTSASSNFLTYPVSGQYSGKFLLLFFTVSFKHLGNSQPNKVLSEAQPRFVQRQSKVIRNKPYQDLYLEWKNS